MLDELAVQHIRFLLKPVSEGKQPSQREIARLTGVSRGTVSAIALGRRPDYRLLPAQTVARDDSSDPLSGPHERCRACGCFVQAHVACRVCRARRVREALRKAGLRTRDDGPMQQLDLDLRPAEQSRYEDVHQRKLVAGNSEAEGAQSSPADPIWDRADEQFLDSLEGGVAGSSPGMGLAPRKVAMALTDAAPMARGERPCNFQSPRARANQTARAAARRR